MNHGPFIPTPGAIMNTGRSPDSITVAEAKRERRALEQAILLKVQEFELKTGLRVHAVALVINEEIGPAGTLFDVSVDARIR